MIITVLAENTAVSDKFGHEHGLSLYIQGKSGDILFDTGAGSLFAENAETAGIKLAKAGTAVISHGHYDHGGGLSVFLKANLKAKIYMHKKAFGKYFALRADGSFEYIGLDLDLAQNSRFVFTGEHHFIDKDTELFSGIERIFPEPSGNSLLYMEQDGAYMPDDFSHEQILVLSENGKLVLLTGCAHNGIENILEHVAHKKGKYPEIVIGGFHLYRNSLDLPEEADAVRKTGEYLRKTGAMCYTCHCTGTGPFMLLKEILKDKIEYISSGKEISI